MRARCLWSDGTSPARTPQVLRSMRMLVPPSRTDCTCAAVSRASNSRTLTNSKLGKLPFTVDCTSAGVVYVLPADSFKAIIQHSSAGAEVGMDNTCVRAALPVHASCVRACGRSHAHPHTCMDPDRVCAQAIPRRRGRVCGRRRGLGDEGRGPRQGEEQEGGRHPDAPQPRHTKRAVRHSVGLPEADAAQPTPAYRHCQRYAPRYV